MEELNSYLCFVSAMAPNLLVNSGDYIAMVDQKICNPDTTGAQIGTVDNSFFSSQINSTRASNSSPMLTKVWLENFVNINKPKSEPISIPLYVSATQAPSTKLPFGIFRLDYCKLLPTESACKNQIGYIDSTSTGLDFYTLNLSGNYSEFFQEFALHLSANSTAKTGSGIVIKTSNLVTPDNPDGLIVSSSTVFAHNADYFYRDDGKNNPQCFRRSINLETFPDEHVWRYGLYHADQGTRIELSPSRAIEYVYSSNNKSSTGTIGKTYNGFIGYTGLSMGGIGMPSGETVSSIDNSTFPPVTTQYTIRKPDGRLLKHRVEVGLIGKLDGIPIQFRPSQNVTGRCFNLDGSFCTTTNLLKNIVMYNTTKTSIYYMISWSAVYVEFLVTERCDSSLKIPCSPFSNKEFTYTVDSASIVNAISSDLSFYEYYKILATEFKKLSPGDPTLVRFHYFDPNSTIVPTTDFDTLNDSANGLKCVGKCPTAQQLSSGTYKPAVGPFAALVNQTYSLNMSTGNMQDGTPSSSTTPTGLSVAEPSSYAVTTGKLVTQAVVDTITALNPCKVPASASAPCFRESDIDSYALVTTGVYFYYTWETSAILGNSAAVLLDSSQIKVPFSPPLPVTFAVPNTIKFGQYAGTGATLRYGSFGNLYGIPTKCIDESSNEACLVDDPSTKIIEATPIQNQRNVAAYSIPFGFETPTSASAIGTVTVNTPLPQGNYNVIAGQKLLVKALEKEIRLSRVTLDTCKIQGLAQPITVTGLPTALDWIDPKKNIGDKPALNPAPAPRVIHGVQQY